MPAARRESGRALLFAVLAIVVAAVVALFVVADPFGSGDAIDRTGDDFEAGDLRTEGDGADPVTGEEREGGGLAGRYGEGDLGSVRLRLLHVSDHRPLPDQALKLIPRTGGGREITPAPEARRAYLRYAGCRGGSRCLPC